MVLKWFPQNMQQITVLLWPPSLVIFLPSSLSSLSCEGHPSEPSTEQHKPDTAERQSESEGGGERKGNSVWSTVGHVR